MKKTQKLPPQDLVNIASVHAFSLARERHPAPIPINIGFAAKEVEEDHWLFDLYCNIGPYTKRGPAGMGELLLRNFDAAKFQLGPAVIQRPNAQP